MVKFVNKISFELISRKMRTFNDVVNVINIRNHTNYRPFLLGVFMELGDSTLSLPTCITTLLYKVLVVSELRGIHGGGRGDHEAKANEKWWKRRKKTKKKTTQTYSSV